ncbi:MAG TPA: Gfo/Idh/MocA family oxidoreductase [Lacipirellulaceae bacterium]|nr:Gfo/Idh/MocA family oxidoreductase [Lacipirellulaceae bacterium]
MRKRTNRRRFLKTTAAGAAGCLILPDSRSAWSYQANEKLNIALIGVGERGRGFIGKVKSMEQNLVAVCDVDERRIKEARGLPEKIRVYRDFRELLDEMDRELDAVIIATPHHSQAAISAAAIRRNKHVYCEKPIAQDVGEARDLRMLVAQHPNVVTQMGNQGLASDSYRRILEQVEDGAVGEIREAHQWFISDYRRDPRDEQKPPADPTALPPELDWDLYLGPAAERPYHHEYMRWSRWRDFATGMLGMGGSHSCHMTFNALGMRALWETTGATGSASAGRELSGSNSREPSPHQLALQTASAGKLQEAGRPQGPDIRNTGKASGTQVNDGKSATIRVDAKCSEAEPLVGPADARFPQWEVVRFEIPARGSMPPATIHWHKGKKADLERMGILEKLEKTAGRSLDWGSGWASESGSLIVGADGMVHTNMHNSECALLPLEKFAHQGGRPKRIPRAGSHEREWVNACRGRGPRPMSNFDYAGPVLELLLLGNISTLVGQPIEFDPVACKITGDDEADRAIRPPRRDGWDL